MPQATRSPRPQRCNLTWLYALCFTSCPPVLLTACGGDDAAAPTANVPDAQDDTSQSTGTPDGSTVAPVEGGSEVSSRGDAESESLADGPSVPLKSPFDWVGIIGTGQSLSVGATAQSMSKTQ